MTVTTSSGLTVCPTTSYTYDGQHRMTTITDPKGILYLTNQYDSGNSITKQTLADGSTYSFQWTFTNTTQGHIAYSGPGGGGGSGSISRGCVGCYEGYMPLVDHVVITDQRGFVRRVDFGQTGYVTSDKYAVGITGVEQDFLYQNFADNLLQKVTDPIVNVTS